MWGGGGGLQPNKDDKACLYIVASWPRRKKERFTDRQEGKLHVNSYDDNSCWSMLGKFHNPSYINSSLLRELFICFYSVAWSVGAGRETHADDTKLVCCFIPVQMHADIDHQVQCVGPR
jgi:hypothetical protein